VRILETSQAAEITAFLLPAILSVTRHGFRGWVIEDLIATLNFALATKAGRIKFCGNPFWGIGKVVFFVHRFKR
jgi:hypothetical protein